MPDQLRGASASSKSTAAISGAKLAGCSPAAAPDIVLNRAFENPIPIVFEHARAPAAKAS
jgi:hypothetical protein